MAFAASSAASSSERRLTTHVLDTATGRPAAGLTLRLSRIEGQDGETRRVITRTETNADGRCDAPLLSGEALEAGTYEIAFEVGAYFARSGTAAGAFLDTVPVRFRVAPASEGAPTHLHVPLLISPYGYSTYRGS